MRKSIFTKDAELWVCKNYPHQYNKDLAKQLFQLFNIQVTLKQLKNYAYNHYLHKTPAFMKEFKSQRGREMWQEREANRKR